MKILQGEKYINFAFPTSKKKIIKFVKNENFMEDFVFVFRMLLAVLCGGLIGIEREIIRRPAGLRTHMLVCLGSCVFMIVSMKFNLDPARIAAGVVTGMGFIGAGTIIAEKEKNQEIVLGITTAASLWTTSSIGLLIGMGEIFLACTSTILVFAILWLRILEDPSKKIPIKK